MTVDYESLYGEKYFRSYGLGAIAPEYLKRLKMYALEVDRISERLSQGVVLDYGCGTGEFLEMLPSTHWRKYGVEPVSCARIAAQDRGISFEIDKLPPGSVDLVIFRGTFQHLDYPIEAIRKCAELLRSGGYMVFLATPNIGSIFYRLFQELPALDPPRNFCLVSDRILSNILVNFGFKIESVIFPYLGTPYAHPVADSIYFLGRFLGFKKKFAFWRNMMEIYARKR
jgi:SAM-dependent methyltransferase